MKLKNSSKKISLSKGETFWHYSPVLFFFIIIGITPWRMIQYYILDMQIDLDSKEVVSFFVLILITLLVFLLQRHRLKFKFLNLSVSNEVFKRAFEKTALELDWSVEKQEKDFIRAHRGWNWSNSWGELITIKKSKDKILINSICDPNAVFMSLISYGWNKKNIRTFMDNLESCRKEEAKANLQ